MSRRTWLRAAVGVLGLAALLVTALGGSAGDGLTEQQAVALARAQAQAMSPTPVSLISVSSGRLGAFETGNYEVDHEVWAVSFSGTFMEASCGPPGPSPSCPCPNTSIGIFLDVSAGAFVVAEMPAPGQSDVCHGGSTGSASPATAAVASNPAPGPAAPEATAHSPG